MAFSTSHIPHAKLVALFCLLYSGRLCSTGLKQLHRPSNADCTRQRYNISLPSYATVPFSDDILLNPNQTIATSLFQRFFTSQANFTIAYSNDTSSGSGSYELSGVLCISTGGDQYDDGAAARARGWIDSSYWDFAYMPEKYSYVQAAAAAGYTTFCYDRLGTGQSQYPGDGYCTVQAATDLEIFSQFVSLLRCGGVNGINYASVIGVGHSYGSFQLAALSAKFPNDVDALILT